MPQFASFAPNTFDRTYEGLRKLQRAGIPFHVICVLTVESMAQPEKLFEFYVENELEYVCFNIEEQEGKTSNRSLWAAGIQTLGIAHSCNVSSTSL
ncbi:MAG: hypothetical protein ACREEK_26895 [Bradyrhizobium sp.]